MAKSGNPMVEPVPEPKKRGIKASITIDFDAGRRMDAIREYYAIHRGPQGMAVTIPELGLTRVYKSADEIPPDGDFAPGHPEFAFVLVRMK